MPVHFIEGNENLIPVSINLKDVIVLSEDNLEIPVWSGKLDSKGCSKMNAKY